MKNVLFLILCIFSTTTILSQGGIWVDPPANLQYRYIQLNTVPATIACNSYTTSGSTGRVTVVGALAAKGKHCNTLCYRNSTPTRIYRGMDQTCGCIQKCAAGYELYWINGEETQFMWTDFICLPKNYTGKLYDICDAGTFSKYPFN